MGAEQGPENSSLPPAEQEPDAFLPRLPQGRHDLPRDYVTHNQRDRLVAATVSVIADRGYDKATVSQIVATAGLSRRTLYQHFPAGKSDCFLGAYDLIAAHLSDATDVAAAGEADWPGRIRATLDAALFSFAANPDLVRFFLIAPLRADRPELAAHHRRFLGCAAARLGAGAPGDRPVSEAFERSLLTGLASLVGAVVEDGEAERLPGLGSELTEIYLAALLGPEIP